MTFKHINQNVWIMDRVCLALSVSGRTINVDYHISTSLHTMKFITTLHGRSHISSNHPELQNDPPNILNTQRTQYLRCHICLEYNLIIRLDEHYIQDMNVVLWLLLKTKQKYPAVLLDGPQCARFLCVARTIPRALIIQNYNHNYVDQHLVNK